MDSVSLRLRPGELVALTGRNGAGKTTLLRLIAGLVRPTEGLIEVFGARPPFNPALLAQVGAIIEEPAFYPWMSGRRNLHVFGLSGIPIARDAIEAALTRVGLDGSDRRPVRAYSQGMRQRLGLARALMREPRLLLLDEPTNGLDPEIMGDLDNLLRTLREQGVAVLLTSHQISQMGGLCDRMLVMDAGRLVDEITSHHREAEDGVAP